MSSLGCSGGGVAGEGAADPSQSKPFDPWLDHFVNFGAWDRLPRADRARIAARFMQHFIVFVLAVFVGFQVIWGVAHSLHTPLMAVTNAISSIIILGALMQIGSGSALVVILAALSVFMCGINIFGGFLVTRRMLAMFQKS